MGSRVVRVGTRASALARTQTGLIVDALQRAHPDLRLELVPITTSGDRTQHTNAPSGDWGSGVFVKELEDALLEERIDLAVHSLKDLPPRLPAGLELVAIPLRADTRDALVTDDGRTFADLPTGARVGSSSARRAAFLQALRPDLQFLPIRGNVETRLRKLHEGQYDAIVLARAGMDRLHIDPPHVVLEPGVLPPAPGQGALGLEARAGDTEIRQLAEPLNDVATATAVRLERRVMELLEGGCRLPVGVLATVSADGTLEVLGGLRREDGSVAINRIVGRPGASEALAHALAERLLAVPMGSSA